MSASDGEFFPEPQVDDPTWGAPAEDITGWLGRSTLPKAVWFRSFLNRNLRLLPPDAAQW